MSTVSCVEDRICKMFAEGFSIEQISKVIYAERAATQKISIKIARQIVESALLTKQKEGTHDKKDVI